MLLNIGISLLAYMIGNLSPAYLCGKVFGKIDIREHGSGNTGATNVIRVMGWRYGVVVFILDIFKGVLAVNLGCVVGAEIGALLAAFFVVMGHDFPILLGFRGGKGIASTFGIFLVLFPGGAVLGFTVFLLVVLLTRMVSMGSLSFVGFLLGFVIMTGQSPLVILLTGVLVVFAFVRHRENIQRVLNGTENKLSLGKMETSE